MPARLSAFVIWILVAFAAAFWGLRLLSNPSPVPSHALAVSAAGGARGDLTRLLGAEPVATAAAESPASSRFKLLGVMAAQQRGEAARSDEGAPGFALISIDGKPARAYAAGASVEDRLVLKSVSLRSASLGPPDGAASIVLEVPRLPAPNTGSLPPIRMDGSDNASAPAPQAQAQAQTPQENSRFNLRRPRGLPQEQAPQMPRTPSPGAQAPVDNDADPVR